MMTETYFDYEGPCGSVIRVKLEPFSLDEPQDFDAVDLTTVPDHWLNAAEASARAINNRVLVERCINERRRRGGS